MSSRTHISLKPSLRSWISLRSGPGVLVQYGSAVCCLKPFVIGVYCFYLDSFEPYEEVIWTQ